MNDTVAKSGCWNDVIVSELTNDILFDSKCEFVMRENPQNRRSQVMSMRCFAVTGM